MGRMLTLYTWTTPNGYKVPVLLEELGLSYDIETVNLDTGEQKTPEYAALNPNNKIPTLIDSDGPDGKPITVFESGAILWYLAEKTGRFLPADARGKIAVMEWLMFQMANVGPMLGQAKHFRMDAPEADRAGYAAARFSKEAKRIYGILEKRLSEVPHLAGEYSIADMAVWPWVRNCAKHGVDLGEFPHLKKWFDALAERPAVKAAYAKVDAAAAPKKAK
jgi:GST-like protein